MALVLASTAVLGLGASGCETTREQAARVAKSGDSAFRQEGLAVARANRAVSVVSTAVISDVNGSAVAAVLKNNGPRALVDVPLQMVARDRSGRATARNDLPGLEHGLTHVALLPPGREVVWVNDQLTLDGDRPVRVAVTPGQSRGEGPSQPIEISVENPVLEGDPASGVTAVGRVVNHSGVAQRDLIVACIARKGGRVVAAGRAIVPNLRANGKATIHIYFIGNPRGAELLFEAQPSTLEKK
ncbi:hypothetical protein Q5424_20810 [Conexibacter sp. JD483]|uniref:hypothetical protein n=1 Tax=unclassified Conexibacter TaxID=2627773 RepID=UPI002718B55E|nr:MULTISPECIES: hypothetical protein [unclassified Conexibacter]MDO8185013.1 hypothetical protein [Conexibacter sp. CPCC 205706]MDO8198157.1 hypothetical protein [Conexibacter sp. CPCC 205762]MDR9371553.1 hypothetical protein [Conexibacter sp. JD483]